MCPHLIFLPVSDKLPLLEAFYGMHACTYTVQKTALARRGKQQWMHTRRDAQPSYRGPHLQHTAHSICKKGGWEAWGCAGCWGTAKEDCFEATTVSTVKYLTVRDFCFSFCFVFVYLYFRQYMGEVVLYPGQFCSKYVWRSHWELTRFYDME